MTPSRAAADERAVILREIDRMLEALAYRSCSGIMALAKLRLWLALRGEKEGVK